MCLNGFSPVVSYAADDYLVAISQNHFTTPLLLNREIEGGYYHDTYLVSQSFELYSGVQNVTLRGLLCLKEEVECHVYDFISDETEYFHIEATINSITTSTNNGEFVSVANSGYGAFDQISGFGSEAFTYSNYVFFVDYCDYYNYSPTIRVNVEYYVTVYSNTNTYKFKLQPHSDEFTTNTVTVENGNTLNDSDVLYQSYMQQIQQSISNIESLKQQGNQLQQENNELLQDAIDKIEDQYSVSEEENFGVEDIVDQVNEKAGVLSFGTDTLVNFLDLFDAANATNTKLTFPGFSMEVQGVEYQVWPDYEYDLSELENQFGALIEVVRWGCVMVVWLAVVNYLVKAYDTIFGR